MTLGNSPIGADAFGGVEEELEGLPSQAPVPRSKAYFIRRRLAIAFRRAGSTALIYIGAPDAPEASASVRCVWRQTRSEELVGPIRQSDMTVLIDAQTVIDSGFPRPLAADLSIVRFPDAPNEHVYTVIEPPVLFDINNEDVLWRCIARG